MLLTSKLDSAVLNDLFNRIRSDVHYFQHMQQIPPHRLRVSIPRHLLNMLEYNHRQIFCANGENFIFNAFGCKVIEGYNNQICVFDVDADIDDKGMEPITIKITDNKWIEINKL